jgi:hypothetical protein
VRLEEDNLDYTSNQFKETAGRIMLDSIAVCKVARPNKFQKQCSRDRITTIAL